jgi:hypothetical protein
MGNAVGKGVRLAGPGACYDQKGASYVTIGGDAVLDSSALLRIERLKI